MKNYTKLLNLFLLMSVVTTLFSTDWPSWRGPNGDGIITGEKLNSKFLKKGTKPLWVSEVGRGYSAPSIQGELLYIMGNNNNVDKVYCLNALTGKEVWSYEYNCPKGDFEGPRVSPLIDNGKVYTLSRKGDLYCFDAKSGKILWSENVVKEYKATLPTWDISGSPVVDGDTLLLNVGYSGLALNKNNGSLIWYGGSGVCGYSTPIVFNNSKGVKSVALMGQNEFIMVNFSDGKVQGTYPWKTSHDVNAADPLIVDNKVFISSGYRKGCTLIDISGKKPVKIWENEELAAHFSSLIYRDGYIYGSHGNHNTRGELKCLDLETGETIWSEKGQLSSIIMVDDKLVVIDQRGTLSIVEATHKGYKKLSEKKLGRGVWWTAPVYSHNIIYVRSSNGKLVALKTV